MLVGWKRLKIQKFNEDGTKLGDLIVIDGKPHEGATVNAEISGLSRDPINVAGSNVYYYTARGGVGEVKVQLGILDLPEDISDGLSGFRVDENKISYVGEDTMPPLCAIEMESKEDNQDIALFGFYTGTFSREKISLQTDDPGKAYTPEAETWNYTPISSKADATNGEVMQKFIGNAKTSADTIKIFEDQLFNPAGSDNPDDPGK
ncbi:major tail protein [Pediococcus acidilactici]|uniref:major tail protein n=1 Tax=Pediococcus acidilactici TaxID=1254 RepID=UPI0023312B59|nr:major tail protein [Pediococcus acidilactici]MDB8858810.1 phage tail protein [Pediococcus acidilactici]MDB8861100.1 phage tail protein [Pediococcus acidilactici]MDB8862008.1 phage tail protein [Pediococcus acidilactici]MDB8865991.1 phage tail protein [Pediococcus acidilactici]